MTYETAIEYLSSLGDESIMEAVVEIQAHVAYLEEILRRTQYVKDAIKRDYYKLLDERAGGVKWTLNRLFR